VMTSAEKSICRDDVARGLVVVDSLDTQSLAMSLILCALISS